MERGPIIAAGSLAFVIVSALCGVVWKLSRVEVLMRAEHSAEIAAVKAAHASELTALQAKVYQVENLGARRVRPQGQL